MTKQSRPNLSPQQRHQIESAFAAYDVPVGDETAAKIAQYLYLLYQWNSKANLTRIAEADAIDGQILDSIIPFLELHRLGQIDKDTSIKLADVGSGGGLPGIPLAIFFPNWRITLIESSARKNTFLSTASSLLGLGLTVHPYRVEETKLSAGLRGSFEIVTARALAPLPLLAEYLLPLCAHNGLVVALKSANAEQELLSAKEAIKINGGLSGEIFDYKLGENSEMSAKRIVTIRKN
jgi:16S rRNA (guanine527-N7)-methyltransferase